MLIYFSSTKSADDILRATGYIKKEEPATCSPCIPDMEEMEKAPLFGPYYDVIANGLRETFGMNDTEIAEYLKR